MVLARFMESDILGTHLIQTRQVAGEYNKRNKGTDVPTCTLSPRASSH